MKITNRYTIYITYASNGSQKDLSKAKSIEEVQKKRDIAVSKFGNIGTIEVWDEYKQQEADL